MPSPRAWISPRNHVRQNFVAGNRSLEVRLDVNHSPRHKRIAQDRHWPPHSVKNKYIQRGFSIHESYWHKLSDIHTFDNETMNIITAIAGFLPSALLGLNLLLMPPIEGFDPKGLYVGIFLFAVNAMLVTGYHTFLSIPHHYDVWSAGDLVGINIAILSLSFCLTYYGFQLTYFHWQVECALMGAIITLLSAFCALYRVIDGRDGLLWLQGVNTACALIFVIPVQIFQIPSTPRGDLFLLLLVLGAIIHVSKIPERFVSSKFDLFGHSHMWWHLAYSFAYYAFFSNMFLLQTDRPDLLWDNFIL